MRVPGFRPGRVPPRIIDQRFGRGVVLEQAVNEAVPQLYGQALQENDVFALGQPELEITKLDDGKELAFTAEVDVRPKFEIPDLTGLPVTVDTAVVTPDEVEEYIGGLRERFASLKGVDRPVEDGDFTSIDLSASVNGEPVEDAQVSGYSYQVGSGSLLDGLDEALTGMSAGESKTFTAELVGGEHGGEQADVTVTVHSVKVKELPELDDEFAQSASEYDTLGEFRAGTRAQLEAMKRMQQVGQARERALDSVLAKIDIPLPDSMVTSETEMRRESLDEQLERAGTTMDAYLESSGQTAEQVETDMERERAALGEGRVRAGPAGPAGRAGHRAGGAELIRHRAGLPDGRAARPAGPGADGPGPDRVRDHRGAPGQGAHPHHRARDRDRRGRQAGGCQAALQPDETAEPRGGRRGGRRRRGGGQPGGGQPARGRCCRGQFPRGQCGGGRPEASAPKGQGPEAPGPQGQGGQRR